VNSRDATDGPGNLSRRRFLQAGAALAPWVAGGCSRVTAGRGEGPDAEDAPAPTGTRLGTVLGPGSYGDDDGGAADRFVLAALDLDDAEAAVRQTELAFLGHGVVLDPTDPFRAAVFEKRGAGACIVDLREGEVVAPIETPAAREFYGHGAFSPDGKLLYATETVIGDGSYRGLIVVRDARTLEELGEFPSHGLSPHDCVLRDGGKTLVVTNGGGDVDAGPPASVTYVDVESEKLLDEVVLPPRLNAGHLALTESGDLAIVSAMRDGLPRNARGGILFRPHGEALATMSSPVEVISRLVGETLSVAIHEPTGVVAATSPKGHIVTFWDLQRGHHLHTLDLPHPRGVAITLDGTRFVISFGRSTSLLQLDAETLRPIPDTRRPHSLMGGSHVIVHELPPVA